jgi:hypothetical protein
MTLDFSFWQTTAPLAETGAAIAPTAIPAAIHRAWRGHSTATGGWRG